MDPTPLVDAAQNLVSPAAPELSEPPISTPDPLLEAAHSFGISYLYPYQRLVVSNVLDDEPEAVTRQIVVRCASAATLKPECVREPDQ